MRARALIVWGDDDKIVPLSAAEAYRRALPDGTRLEIVPGCGHFIDMEKPEALARLVADFVTAD